MSRRKNRNRMADIPAALTDPLSAAASGRDRSILEIVRMAVQNGSTVVAYQPVVQSGPNGQIAFYEGFIRVMDLSGRVIPAGDFMPQIEKTELARDIDCVALEQGLRTLMRHPDLRISINMSARSIGYDRWTRTLNRYLKQSSTLGERLILEMNADSAMAAPELVMDFMDRLQTHGISFALDDFGVGQIVFQQFRDFFFDAVKIDGQFIRGVHADRANQTLVTALVQIARTFDMMTIAESVETAEDVAFLTDLGVDCLQGYYFAAPTIRPPWTQKGKQASA